MAVVSTYFLTNKMKKTVMVLSLLLGFHAARGQTKISGNVFELIKGKEASIPGATVQWIPDGPSAFTDAEGRFELSVRDTSGGKLIVSFPGYINDTVTGMTPPLRIQLKKPIGLSEVKITSNRDDIKVSTINPMNVESVTEQEILKAACCNLSEAFETNPSVNVAYKDAVTGVKEILLLGLGGKYVQMLGENIPEMRGLGGIYGLTFIPGPWIESIQLTKGSGSVLYGSESTTGQINIEFKKPYEMKQPRFYLNLFTDENLGNEANIIWKKGLKNWSTMILGHGKIMTSEVDRNGDGFMDVPGNKTINLYNRWKYSGKRVEGQINLRFLADELEGGQMKDVAASRLYRTGVSTRRADVSGKLGIVFPEKPLRSIGNIVQFTYHDMNSFFGDRTYDASQTSFYLQSIYQDILWMSNHRYRTGVTYRYDRLTQEFAGLPGLEEEHIPGVFLEYTYSYLDKLTVIAGMREDLYDKGGVFIPRLNGKYNFTQDFIVRFSGGKSYRRPYIIADNLSVLASSRRIVIGEVSPERAWNYGLNTTIRFSLFGKETTLNADAYRTEFVSQVVVDTYSDSTTISFYNLDGESFSNSVQLTININLLDYLNLRLAYKNDDVKSTFNKTLQRVPLVAADRFLGNVSAETPNGHWKFSYTVAWEGRKKLQNLNFDQVVKDNYSPSFAVMNVQLTKLFRRFELYGGAENLFDYRQKDPIIHPENPFGNSFDATNIWGPVAGRRVYAGIRYEIK